MKRSTKEDWFNVASICSEWIRGQIELESPLFDFNSFQRGSLVWSYYNKTLDSRVWSLYHKTLDKAGAIINPIQPFTVTCENEMFVALQIACEKAGLCR